MSLEIISSFYEDIFSFKSRREDVEEIFERFRQKIQRYVDNKDAITEKVMKDQSTRIISITFLERRKEK